MLQPLRPSPIWYPATVLGAIELVIVAFRAARSEVVVEAELAVCHPHRAAEDDHVVAHALATILLLFAASRTGDLATASPRAPFVDGIEVGVRVALGVGRHVGLF